MVILALFQEKTPPTRGVIPQRNVPGHRCNVQSTPVQGFFSKYVPREGVQYYRDLAGNVKQVIEDDDSFCF